MLSCGRETFQDTFFNFLLILSITGGQVSSGVRTTSSSLLTCLARGMLDGLVKLSHLLSLGFIGGPGWITMEKSLTP